MGTALQMAPGGFPVPLVGADRIGWFRPNRPFDALQLRALLAYPGVYKALPTRRRPDIQYWIPWGLASARPDLFTLPPAGGIPQGEELQHAPLRQYQRDCVAFGLGCRGGGVYLGLDLGLGKSRCAAGIAVAEGHKRVLVCGPLISRGAWHGPRSELSRAFGLDAVPLRGRVHIHEEALTLLRDRTDAEPSWIFIHYDILDAWKGYLLNFFQPTCIIFDEIDYLRGAGSKMSRAARAVARLRSVTRRIGLSATPAHNSRWDLWPQLDALEPDAYGNRHQFLTRWCGGYQDEWGWKEGEPTNQEEFRSRLLRIYVRLERRDVLSDLPPITRQRVDVELDPDVMAEYEEAFRDIRSYVMESSGRAMRAGSPEALARSVVLMRLLANAKVPTSVEQAKNALKAGNKVVVFSWFKESTRRIARALGCEAITGDDSIDVRLEAAASFECAPEARAFVATIAAAGTSLNGLQAAPVVITNDLWWSPSKLLQAEGRVYRQGQSSGVTSLFSVGLGTIDEELLEVLLTKAGAIAATTGDSDPMAIAEVLDHGGAGEDDQAAMEAFVRKLSSRLTNWETAARC